jgi:hypothetical protein
MEKVLSVSSLLLLRHDTFTLRTVDQGGCFQPSQLMMCESIIIINADYDSKWKLCHLKMINLSQ